jgi:acetyl/propionyl-CoA carboxylase alpha subunit
MRFRYQSGDKIYQVALEPAAAGYLAQVDGLPVDVVILDQQPGQISLSIAGRSYTLYWANDGGVKWVSLHGCTYRLERPSSSGAAHGADRSAEGTVRAPMPAQVRALQVAEGELVEKGQVLLILEAMKMEIRIQAPRAGRVASLSITVGETISREQILAVIE